MECKHTYYEIVEIFPSKLKAKMPLITIFRYISYMFLLTIYFLRDLFTFKRSFASLFKKEEITLGREKNDFVINDFLEDENEPTKTESKYFSISESKKLWEGLKNDNDLSSLKISSPFFIKRRVEYFDKENCKDKTFITINEFIIVQKINNALKDPYEKIS